MSSSADQASKEGLSDTTTLAVSPIHMSETGDSESSLGVIVEVATTKPLSQNSKEPSLSSSIDTTSEHARLDGDQPCKLNHHKENASEPADGTATSDVKPEETSEANAEIKEWDWRIFTLTLVRHGQVRSFSF